MLGIPLISDYIQKVVKPQVIADNVDHLNYYCTSLMLALAALAISAKQYFGSPIQCWVPMEFRGGWEKYAEDYCFIQNSYYVPFEEEIPQELNERKDQISYYRWVPIALALQALMFFAPNHFWNMFYKETAIQPQGIVKEAKKCSSLHGKSRELEVRKLAEFIGDTVSVFNSKEDFDMRLSRSGRNAVVLYLLTKLLYVVNIIGQLYMLNHFLGGDYLHWGFETVKDVISGEEWTESPIFPRVIMCDFQVRRLGNIQRHTVQCVIMMNMINEKFYLFLWFWLIFVGICTVLNLAYYFFVLTVPNARAQLVLWNINRHEWKVCGFSSSDMARFVNNFLRPDGVLLLKFISEHVGARISRELVNELIRIYAKQNELNLTIDNDGDTKQASSPSSDEKSPLTNGKMISKGYYGNFEKKPFNLSKATAPLPDQMRLPASGACYESAPALDDFVDGGSTLSIRAMARAPVAQLQNHSAVDFSSSPRLQQRQNTPTEV